MPCSTDRPFDLALSDHFQGNDLFWQELHDDQPKPDDWRWQEALTPIAKT